MVLPLYQFKRHPFPVEAHFEFVLVLTYALPKTILIPLLPPGLILDCYGEHGFVAAAFVQTRRMRPRGWPSVVGMDFFLSGYRIFTRFRTNAGPTLRGLRILRSDADCPFMIASGNLLTHYKYHHADVKINRTKQPDQISLEIQSNDGRGDVVLSADLDQNDDFLPQGSPFATVRDARKFAGPLPFTFDYEEETNSIIRVEGVRSNWHPRSVQAEVKQLSFLDQPPFNQCKPVFCSAFWLEDVPYYWKRGVVESISQTAASHSEDSSEQTSAEDDL